MDSLRVDSGIKNIEVNDQGEYIPIPISDTTFYERFGEILKYFDNKQTDIERQAKELSEKYPEAEKTGTDEAEAIDLNVDMIIDVTRMYSDLCKDVCIQLDKLFGEGCCRKVFFGVASPGIELIGDFFEKITPLLQKYADERNAKFNLKYSRKRKGARSV